MRSAILYGREYWIFTKCKQKSKWDSYEKLNKIQEKVHVIEKVAVLEELWIKLIKTVISETIKLARSQNTVLE